MTTATATRKVRGGAAIEEPVLADVVSRLEFDILFGHLKPRERLVEDVLMQRLGAKRHVVRQALVELERMGIVARMPNRGAVVRDFTAQEVEEICEIRELLQRRAAQRMPLPASPDLIKQLEQIQHRHDRAISQRDPRAIDAANEEFHQAIFNACGSVHLAQAITHYAYLTRAMRLYPLVDADLLETLRAEHWAMIEALRTGDRRALMRLSVAHIQHSKKIYLSVRTALSIRGDGRHEG